MLNQVRQLLPENSRQYREETSQRIAWGHWFALFNIVLALLIASRYAFEADWPNTLLGKLYFFVSLFGHFSFVIFAVYLLLLFPLSFVIKHNRAFRAISVVVASAGLTVLLVDTEVFKRFYLHLSPLVWDLLVNPDEGELARHWQLLFVPMPLILLAQMLYSRWCWNKLRSFSRQKWGKYVALFFLACFTLTHLVYAWADMTVYRPITAQKANYPLSYPMTARSFLEKHGFVDKQDLAQRAEEQGRADTFFLNYPKNNLVFGPLEQPINLVIINLSELNNQDIAPETMPTLWQISQQSQRFMQHYSGGDSKAASLVSLFYSLSGRYTDAILNEQTPSPLIQALQAAHYELGLFSHNGFAEPIYGRSLFKDFKLPQAKDNAEAIGQWQAWLEKAANQPHFSYLDLASENKASLDQALQTIWTRLEGKGLLHKSLILITAEKAGKDLNSNSFAQDQIEVPFLAYWQGQPNRYNSLSSQLDIMPTLLKQFFKVQNPVSDFAQGIDLTQENHRRWILASNYQWNVAILPTGEQYQIDRKGHLDYYDSEGNKQKASRPPLAMFLQLLQQSNQFVEK
ncbi:hypothetical protein A4G20_05830 [Pasteurellaceae bacterium RH1A]|nr:hypothetical protein A4G20_05830 [Pasteurellaceae bacterium RH1A]